MNEALKGGISVLGLLRSSIIRLRSSVFLRNVAVVSTGSFLAQAIQVIASPLLTRLYSPADFGIWGIFNYLVPVLTVLATLQYSMAIVLPEQQSDAQILMGISLLIAILSTFFMLVVSLLINYAGLWKVGVKEIPWIILPASVLGTLLQTLAYILHYWNIRMKSFILMTVAIVVGAFVTVLVSLGIGIFAAGWWGLVAGMLGGKVVNLAVQLFSGGRFFVLVDSLKLSRNVEMVKLKLREYSDFPRFRLPRDLLLYFSQYLPLLMFVAFFGSVIGGFFTLAMRIIALPVVLLSDSVGKVFYQKATELKNRGYGLFKVTLKATLALGGVGIVLFLIILFFGPAVFSFVFGRQWQTAGIYARWLTIGMFFAFCSIPCQVSTLVIRRQKFFLVFQFLAVVLTVLSLTAGGLTGKPMSALFFYAVTLALVNGIFIFLTLSYLFRDEKEAVFIRVSLI